jgi:hypothetical protein
MLHAAYSHARSVNDKRRSRSYVKIQVRRYQFGYINHKLKKKNKQENQFLDCWISDPSSCLFSLVMKKAKGLSMEFGSW